MFPQYGELRPTSGWDRLTSLGYPCKFQLVSRLGSVTARHLVVGVSQTLRRCTEGATYIRQGDHHVGHWPTFLVTFCVSRRWHKMYCGHARLCVCLSVCLSVAIRPHYCTDLDVTWGHGRGCPLVVHYWADLQSGHELRCYGSITRTLVTSLHPSRNMMT